MTGTLRIGMNGTLIQEYAHKQAFTEEFGKKYMQKLLISRIFLFVKFIFTSCMSIKYI